MKSWVHDQLDALPMKKIRKGNFENSIERDHTEMTSEVQSIFFLKNEIVILITQMTMLSFFFFGNAVLLKAHVFSAQATDPH